MVESPIGLPPTADMQPAIALFGSGPRLRENVRAQKVRRIVFSNILSREPSPALLFFKMIEVETKFPFANSISEFSRSQDPSLTSAANFAVMQNTSLNSRDVVG